MFKRMLLPATLLASALGFGLTPAASAGWLRHDVIERRQLDRNRYYGNGYGYSNRAYTYNNAPNYSNSGHAYSNGYGQSYSTGPGSSYRDGGYSYYNNGSRGYGGHDSGPRYRH